MPGTVNIDRHIKAIAASRSLIEAAGPLAALSAEMGLRGAVIQDFAAADLLMAEDNRSIAELLGWEAVYIDEWRANKLYLIDPLARTCRVAVKPFLWDAEAIAEMAMAADPKGRRAWHLLPERGVVGGIAIPIHLPMSRVASIGFVSFDKSIDLADILERHGPALRLVGHVFMDRVYEARPDETQVCSQVSLTEREIECLTWVALGKTDAEIGMILNRSHATARFHVDKAAEKLGAANRTRAVALAVQLGVISAVRPN